MSDDPLNEDIEEIRKFRALAPFFRKGLAKLHPMPARDRALIDAAFSQTQDVTKAKTPKVQKPKGPVVPRRRKSSTNKDFEQSQNKTQGPSHSH